MDVNINLYERLRQSVPQVVRTLVPELYVCEVRPLEVALCYGSLFGYRVSQAGAVIAILLVHFFIGRRQALTYEAFGCAELIITHNYILPPVVHDLW